MKKVIAVLAGLTATLNVFAQSAKTDSFTVSGNCNMCKKRIEKAALTDGVTKALWNVDTKVMTITYDSAKTSAEAVQKKIAVSGHDTEKQKATESAYNLLPGCCRYERK
ncbi:heavy-metal-associated domain-containing protein [Chitinophaga lutea]|uniref:heavy-metal-associated domain-containing protein n=1 Tax=Chitinophaga lutea TaxID=2488634 RepID=UPI001C6FD0BC|nr:heavy-metal-associated domain-containing protein [Chitinophaga lutea]